MQIAIPPVPFVVLEPVANTTLTAGLTAARASGLTSIDLGAASAFGVSATIDVVALAVRFRRRDQDRCRIRMNLRLGFAAEVETRPSGGKRRLSTPLELEIAASLSPEIALDADGSLQLGLRRGSVRVEHLAAEGALGPGLRAALRSQLFRSALENVMNSTARASRGARTTPTSLLAASGLAGPVRFQAYDRMALLTLRPRARRERLD